MSAGSSVLLRCAISSGAFSGEKVFKVNLAKGDQHQGVSPVFYCFHENRQKLAKSEPGDQEIKGLVYAKVIKNGGATAFVTTPDMALIEVNPSEISGELKSEANLVLVGS
jgi:hypothetical protein